MCVAVPVGAAAVSSVLQLLSASGHWRHTDPSDVTGYDYDGGGAGQLRPDTTTYNLGLEISTTQHWLVVDWTLNTIHYAYAAMIQIETLY